MTLPADPEVVVLAGGLSIEREVSLRSATRVAGALEESGYDVTIVDMGPGAVETLLERTPDVVWPVLHGAAGEDGSLSEMLRLVAVPVVGSGPEGCRLSWDKSVAAAAAGNAGIAVPAAVTLPVTMLRDMGTRRLVPAIMDALGQSLVVKPNRGGSSFGLSFVEGVEQLPGAMMLALGHDSACRIERFVAGIEVAVTVIDEGRGPVALPAVEIEPDDGDYDFKARYTVGATEFHCPARLDRSVAERLEQDAVLVHAILGLGSLSRSDWIVDASGVPWFLEVNTSPGMTDTSTTPLAMTNAGRSLPVACTRLIKAARILDWKDLSRIDRVGMPA